jgi:predicted dehydrogenase
MKIAIIGCGLIGQKRAKLLHNVDIACDLNLETAKKVSSLFSNCVTTNNVDDVIDSDVEVVFVSVANSSLAPIAEKLIRKGKHVLLEKPGGITADELINLKDISISTNSLIRIGYNHRYHPACLKALELVKEPEFGEIMFVRGRYGHGGRIGYEKEWRANSAISGGGELIDQGVHLIDLASIFIGKFETIEGHIHTYYWNMNVDDNAFISLQNQKKNTAWLHVSCTEWKNTFSLEIYGKNAKLHWEGLGGSYGTERLTHYQMLKEMGPPKTVIYEYPMGDNSWKIEMDEFFKDIQLNRQPIPGLNEGIETLKVVDTLYKQKL